MTVFTMPVRIATYSKTELAGLYKVNRKVFEGWIEDIKGEICWREQGKQLFPPKAVKRIFEHLGEPE